MGQGRTVPDVYKPRNLVTVTVLGELQARKDADDRDGRNTQDTGRDEAELRGQSNGIWLWRARENFQEEVAFELGLEK